MDPLAASELESIDFRRTTAARESFIGRPLLKHTPYQDSGQDADGHDDEDQEDDTKRAARYAEVPGYQINATHSRRCPCVLVSKVRSVDAEHSDNRQETNYGSQGDEERNCMQPSVKGDAPDKGRKEGKGESWPVATVVEVADDERRHGTTLTRANCSATHKPVPRCPGSLRSNRWWAAVDSNHLPPRPYSSEREVVSLRRGVTWCCRLMRALFRGASPICASLMSTNSGSPARQSAMGSPPPRHPVHGSFPRMPPLVPGGWFARRVPDSASTHRNRDATKAPHQSASA
jgi:hypothetical protein